MKFHLDPNRSVGSANCETIDPQCGYSSQLSANADDHWVVQGGFPISFKLLWWDRMLQDWFSLLYLDLEYGLSSMHMRSAYAGKMQKPLVDACPYPVLICRGWVILCSYCRITNIRQTLWLDSVLRIQFIEALDMGWENFRAENESENESHASIACFGKCQAARVMEHLDNLQFAIFWDLTGSHPLSLESRFDRVPWKPFPDPLSPDLSSGPSGVSVEQIP